MGGNFGRSLDGETKALDDAVGMGSGKAMFFDFDEKSVNLADKKKSEKRKAGANVGVPALIGALPDPPEDRAAADADEAGNGGSGQALA